MIRVLLAAVYPALLAARMVNAVLDRDPLRRSKPATGSLWVVRDTSASDAGYFSEKSPVERSGRNGSGFPRAILLWLSRLYVPPRSQPREKFTPAADREQGIPDEMYTLW